MTTYTCNVIYLEISEDGVDGTANSFVFATKPTDDASITGNARMLSNEFVFHFKIDYIACCSSLDPTLNL